MTGRYRIIVQNRRLHYALEIKRNITIIQGDSATGKTTLIDMLRQYMNLQESSGIHVECAKPCRILEGPDWELILKNLSGYIIFIDEGNSFISSQRFAEMVKGSDNYFVLITRESLYNLPYSVDVTDLHLLGSISMQRKRIRRCIRFILLGRRWICRFKSCLQKTPIPDSSFSMAWRKKQDVLVLVHRGNPMCLQSSNL